MVRRGLGERWCGALGNSGHCGGKARNVSHFRMVCGFGPGLGREVNEEVTSGGRGVGWSGGGGWMVGEAYSPSLKLQFDARIWVFWVLPRWAINPAEQGRKAAKKGMNGGHEN